MKFISVAFCVHSEPSWDEIKRRDTGQHGNESDRERGKPKDATNAKIDRERKLRTVVP